MEPKHPSRAHLKQPPMRGKPLRLTSLTFMVWEKILIWKPLSRPRPNHFSMLISRSPVKPTPDTEWTMPIPFCAS